MKNNEKWKAEAGDKRLRRGKEMRKTEEEVWECGESGHVCEVGKKA